MKYALSLGEGSRILYACIVLQNGDYSEMTVVDHLPDGNIYEYLYIDNQYIYSPIRDQDPKEYIPTADEILNILLGCENE